MSNKFLISGVVLVAAGMLVFGRFSDNNSAPASNLNLRGASVAGISAKNTAPDFTLQKLDGGTITLSEFRGKKSVVVDFWASWCPNCRRDMPKLNGFYEKYKDRVEVIGVNLQEKDSTVRDFIASRGISFPIALDSNGQASNAFGIRYTNTHFLIDKDGNLVRTIPGDINEADIVSLIEQAALSEDQSYLPDKEPCKIASAENSEQAGVCKNSS